MTEEQRAELEKLARAATPGPWRSVIDDTGGQWSGWPLCIVPENDDDRSVVRTGGQWPYEWDTKVCQHEAISTAAYIVAACNAVPDLLATIARLEAEKVKDGEALERLASGEAFDLPQVISGPLAEELRMRMDFARARLSSRAKDQSQ